MNITNMENKREISFAPGYYITDQGVIYSKANNAKPLRPKTERNGYQRVTLKINGERKMYSVHRLVALTFLDKPIDKNYINHKNNNKLDNRAENLEWCTQSYNIKYAFQNGRKVAPHRKMIVNINTGIFYESQREAADAHNLNQATLSLWLNNKFPNKSPLMYI